MSHPQFNIHCSTPPSWRRVLTFLASTKLSWETFTPFRGDLCRLTHRIYETEEWHFGNHHIQYFRTQTGLSLLWYLMWLLSVCLWDKLLKRWQILRLNLGKVEKSAVKKSSFDVHLLMNWIIWQFTVPFREMCEVNKILDTGNMSGKVVYFTGKNSIKNLSFVLSTISC